MVYFSNTAPTDLLDLQVNYNINWFYLFIFFFFASSFLPPRQGDVALGECEDSLLLDKRASGRPDFFSSLSGVSPEGKAGEKKTPRQVWEPPPGKEGSRTGGEREPPSGAQTGALPMGTGGRGRYR